MTKNKIIAEVSQEFAERLSELAKHLGMTKAGIVKTATFEYLENHGRKI